MNINDVRLNAYKKANATAPNQNATNDDVQHLLKVPRKDSVYRKVAKFLVLIGTEEAAKILPHLTQEQTEKIIPEIASIRTISDDDAEAIFEEFQGLYQHITQKGGKETARAILEKAYGTEKANSMISKVTPYEGNKPFEYFDDVKSERIFQILKDESNATRTLVLSYINPKKSAEIINLMAENDKTDVIRRLAKMEAVQPEILARVDAAMKEKANSFFENEKSENIDGINALAEILKKMPPNAENEIISSLSKDEPELSENLQVRLWTVDDVINCDNVFIQKKLQTMQNIDIAKLIAKKPDIFRQKILSCVSQGRREEILDEEKISSPFLKVDCERITNDFYSFLRKAFENGEVIIKGRNDDEYV